MSGEPDPSGEVAGPVVVVAGEAATAALHPLLETWRTQGEVRLLPWGAAGPGELSALARGARALLLVGPRNRAPRTVLPGPVVATQDGRLVPAAWLPATGAVDVARFARTAAAVHARAPVQARTPGRARRSLAVLGERQPRFDRLAERVLALASADPGLLASRRTAYEVDRAGCAALLGSGPALALYVGHGRPVGWVGYAGMRAHHLGPDVVGPDHRPTAALVSLTCKTASRRRTGLSFTEAVVLRGVAAAALGAVGPTAHPANARWAVRVARDLAGTATVGDLAVRLATCDPHAASYRLVGDPTAPLLDDHPSLPSLHPLEEAS